MGSDLIQKATPTFKKSWDKARVALATADLFTRTPDCAARTAAGDIVGDAKLQVGECVVVEKGDNGLIGRRGLTQVLHINDPPAELVSAVEASCGVAKGTVEQIHEHAGVAEVSLC